MATEDMPQNLIGPRQAFVKGPGLPKITALRRQFEFRVKTSERVPPDRSRELNPGSRFLPPSGNDSGSKPQQDIHGEVGIRRG
jgi:hypothetical protein